MKGDYEPIINWYQELYANIDHIVGLLSQGDCNQVFPFLLNSFKPGLVSKSQDVAIWAARFISKLGLEFHGHQNIKDAAWRWFAENNGGLRTCTLALKRHNDLRVKENLVKIMEQFGRDNFREMFTDALLKISDEPK